MESCGKCDKEVKDGEVAIECEICSLWFHRRCSSLSGEQFKQAGGDSDLHWYCRSCSKVARGLVLDVKKLKIVSSDLTKRVAIVESRVSDQALEERVRSVVEEVVGSKLSDARSLPSVAGASDIAGVVQSREFRRVVYDETREIAERDIRKSSIVIKGLGANIELIQEKFSELTEELLSIRIRLSDIVCINSHMCRAKVLDDDARRRLLENVRNLRHSSKFSSVYVNRDLTKLQREEIRQRRGRLRSSGPSNGSEGQTPASGANRVPIRNFSDGGGGSLVVDVDLMFRLAR